MKVITMQLFALLFAFELFGQGAYSFNSSIDVPIQNTMEGNLNEEIEQYLLHAWDDKPNLSAYDPFSMLSRPLTLAEVRQNVKNEIDTRFEKADSARIILSWNNTLDTANLLAYYELYRQEKSNPNSLYRLLTPLLLVVPLSEYHQFLSNSNMENLSGILKDGVESGLKMRSIGNRLISEDRIPVQNLDILAHAPSERLVGFLTNYSRFLHTVYSSPSQDSIMKKGEIENSWTTPDTFNIEGYIHITHRVAEVQDIIIISDWQILEGEKASTKTYRDIKPFMTLIKQISMLGIKLDNGMELYLDYQGVKNSAEEYNIDWAPYEQILKGISFNDIPLDFETR